MDIIDGKITLKYQGKTYEAHIELDLSNYDTFNSSLRNNIHPIVMLIQSEIAPESNFAVEYKRMLEETTKNILINELDS